MTGDTTADDSRLTRRQRAAVSILAVVCILLTGATLVAAQTGSTGNYHWSFEADDNVTETDSTGVANVGTTDQLATDGNDSLEVLIHYQSGSFDSIRIDSDQQHVIDSQQWQVTFDWAYELEHVSGSTGTKGQEDATYRVGIEDDSAETYMQYDMNPGSQNTISVVADNTQSDTIEVGQTGPTEQQFQNVRIGVNGTHTILEYNDENVTVNAVDSFSLADTRLDIRAQDAYGNYENYYYLDNVQTGQFVPDLGVDLDANNYMRPGTRQHYTVELSNGSDVTGTANVTSSDSDVISVNETNGTLLATENSSALPDEVTITAEVDGDADTKTITVAEPSIENLDQLPTWWKVNATVGDGMMLWLIGATLFAIVATRIANSFAGIGAYTMLIIAGWVSGPVSNGVLVVTLLTGIFLGMNLALNIDTTVKGGG